MLLFFPKRAPPSIQVKCKRIDIILLWSRLVGQLLFSDINTADIFINTAAIYIHQNTVTLGLSGYPASSFNESASCVQGGCKFKCDAVDRAHIPCLFPKKMRLAGILPHSLGSLSLCFLG